MSYFIHVYVYTYSSMYSHVRVFFSVLYSGRHDLVPYHKGLRHRTMVALWASYTVVYQSCSFLSSTMHWLMYVLHYFVYVLHFPGVFMLSSLSTALYNRACTTDPPLKQIVKHIIVTPCVCSHPCMASNVQGPTLHWKRFFMFCVLFEASVP